VLELQRLVKHYHTADEEEPIRVVDGVSMTVASGEFIAVYGPSGSGKTTLLGLIAATIKPDSGRVLVAGRDLAIMSSKEADSYRLHELGIIDQPDALFPGAAAHRSASLKLWLTNRRDARAIVEPLLEQLGLGARASHRTETLSMGERQRVAIARALAADPKIVLADEPTGNLDPRRTLEVLTMLRTLCTERGVITILATHDEQAAAFADQVYELRGGQLRSYQPRFVEPQSHSTA
jgi:putative ABC transport system ATP-binding protein